MTAKSDPLWRSPIVSAALRWLVTALVAAIAGVLWQDHERGAEHATRLAVIDAKLDAIRDSISQLNQAPKQSYAHLGSSHE